LNPGADVAATIAVVSPFSSVAAQMWAELRYCRGYSTGYCRGTLLGTLLGTLRGTAGVLYEVLY
jgi:hypothetical protein